MSHRPSVARALALGALIVACQGEPPPGRSDLAAAGAVFLPFLPAPPALPDADGLPIVAGSLDGRPVRLLLDTGAEASILSAALLGVAPDQGAAAAELCLGSLCWRRFSVWAADTVFSRAEEGGINGIIGMEPLRHFVLDLDHDRGVTLSRTSRGCPGDVVPLGRDEVGRPTLPVRVDDQDLGVILLDTGARHTLLSQASAQRLPHLAAAATEVGACSISGCTSSGAHLSRAGRVCVGPTCLEDVSVKYPAWDALGSSFLRRLRATIDLPASTLTFCRP